LEKGPLERLASILSQVLRGLRAILGRFPFNVLLHSAPVGLPPSTARSFHWRLEILPRVTVPSGFELGWDAFIVDVSPEASAAKLRAVMAKQVA
jgi:UDPglucose--hexose-1-phosphate uridylyltransferase